LTTWPEAAPLDGEELIFTMYECIYCCFVIAFRDSNSILHL
jgi:hypothetical protein